MKVKIIFGSPCSGKSTYCRENIKENDLVYDYDELSNAITYGTIYELERSKTHDYVMDFRYSILRRIKNDNSDGVLFFICSKTKPESIIEMLDGVDCEVIEMKTTFEECLKNLENDDRRKDKEKWKERIENWFKEFKMIPKEKLENRQFRKLESVKTADEEESYIVRGYAAKYEPYTLYENSNGAVKEEFRKNAFNNTDMSDVIFLYDHKGKVLARNSNGTLKLSLDDVGLYIEADLSTSEAAREMYREIKSGLVTKMSWSFKVGEYHFDEKTRTIVHEKIKKIYDVSAVGIPANSETEINARNFCDGVIAEIEAERLKIEQRRKKVKLLIELEEK